MSLHPPTSMPKPEQNPIPPEAYERFCINASRLAFAWAEADQALDGWVSIFVHGVQKKKNCKLPRHFAPKVALIRKTFDEVADLRDIAPVATKVVDELEKAADLRHALMHGFPIGYDHRAGGIFTMSGVDLVDSGTFHAEKLAFVNLLALENTRLVCEEATQFAYQIVAQLLERYPSGPAISTYAEK